jgi:hypothetical protein
MNRFRLTGCLIFRFFRLGLAGWSESPATCGSPHIQYTENQKPVEKLVPSRPQHAGVYFQYSGNRKRVDKFFNRPFVMGTASRRGNDGCWDARYVQVVFYIQYSLFAKLVGESDGFPNVRAVPNLTQSGCEPGEDLVAGWIQAA